MNFTIRGVKISRSSKTGNSTATCKKFTPVKRIVYPSLPLHFDKKFREAQSEYQVKALIIIAPADTDIQALEFIEAAVLSNSVNNAGFREHVNVSWVGVLITNSWTIVFKQEEPNVVIFPRGYDLEVEEKLLPSGDIRYRVSMPTYYDDFDHNQKYIGEDLSFLKKRG